MTGTERFTLRGVVAETIRNQFARWVTLVVGIVVAAGVSVIWIGWAGAAVVLVVGLASVLINPAMGATWSRAKERQEIIVIDKLRAQGIDENQDNVLSEPPGTAIPALPALTAHDDRRHP